MEFATKEDLIKRYAAKRKGIDESEVRDLLDALLEYTVKQLAPRANNTEFAFRLENFGTFFEKEFNSKALTQPYNAKERIKTEKMLTEYILTGIVKPKKVDIFNDYKHRI
jgi:nucleoid DNA-binding protein